VIPSLAVADAGQLGSEEQFGVDMLAVKIVAGWQSDSSRQPSCRIVKIWKCLHVNVCDRIFSCHLVQ